MIDYHIMKMYRIVVAIALISLFTYFPAIDTAYSDVFKIEKMDGNWRDISDTYLASEESVGEANISLYADGYRMGSWIISYDMDLSVEVGGRIRGILEIAIDQLNITLTYIEEYENNGVLGNDKIFNSLKLTVNGEVLFNRNSSASEPFNSRLNTRFYFALMKVLNKLYLVLRDEYGDTGSPESIYVEKELEYHDQPLTLRIKAYKNSYEYKGSIKIPFLINLPKDSISYDKLDIVTLDYTPNAIFFLSMSFLIGAIAFNVISTKFRVMSEEAELKKPKKGKTSKKS